MSDWAEHKDPSGKPYYYNAKTCVTSWEAPPGFADAQASTGGWAAVVDSATGKTYYHNSITNATSWDVPAGFNAGGGDATSRKEKVVAKRGAIGKSKKVSQPQTVGEKLALRSKKFVALRKVDKAKNQPSAFSRKRGAASSSSAGGSASGTATVSSPSAAASLPPPPAAAVPSAWQAVKTDSGETYYYNATTGETSWTLPAKDDCTKTYKIGEELGRGSFAIVKRAQHLKEKTDWAVKVFDKRSLGDEDEASLRQEVSILRSLKHPHIVELREVFDTKKTFYMVMELMSGGELFERIVSKSKYSEREASDVARKIASALKFCHDKNVVHRDLKPENLLYTDTTEAAEIKIADFGFAKLIAADKVMATACGTPGYVAPEVLNNEHYTSKVDMWSLGVIIYILLCGFPPFYDENNAALFKQIQTASFEFMSPFWDDVSESAKDLVRKLLVVDVQKRLSADDVLAHSWIKDGGLNNSNVQLVSAYSNLRKHNARRRFRQGVKKVIAAQTFMRFGKLGALMRTAREAAAAAEASKASTEANAGASS